MTTGWYFTGEPADTRDVSAEGSPWRHGRWRRSTSNTITAQQQTQTVQTPASSSAIRPRSRRRRPTLEFVGRPRAQDGSSGTTSSLPVLPSVPRRKERGAGWWQEQKGRQRVFWDPWLWCHYWQNSQTVSSWGTCCRFYYLLCLWPRVTSPAGNPTTETYRAQRTSSWVIMDSFQFLYSSYGLTTCQ